MQCLIAAAISLLLGVKKCHIGGGSGRLFFSPHELISNFEEHKSHTRPQAE